MNLKDIIELAKLGWKPSDVKELLAMPEEPKEEPKKEAPKDEPKDDPKKDEPKDEPKDDPFEKLAKS